MKALLLCLLPALCYGQEQKFVKAVGIGVVSQANARAVGGYVKHTWFYEGAFGGLGAEVTAIRSAHPFLALTVDGGVYLLDANVRPFLYGQSGIGCQLPGASGAFAEVGAGVEVSRWQLLVTCRAFDIRQVNENQVERPAVSGFYLKLGFHVNR